MASGALYQQNYEHSPKKAPRSNLLAGIQIAISEPIRIDDVVILQGEWGRVEEITTSYVVIAIWNLRRHIDGHY